MRGYLFKGIGYPTGSLWLCSLTPVAAATQDQEDDEMHPLIAPDTQSNTPWQRLAFHRRRQHALLSAFLVRRLPHSWSGDFRLLPRFWQAWSSSKALWEMTSDLPTAGCPSIFRLSKVTLSCDQECTQGASHLSPQFALALPKPNQNKPKLAEDPLVQCLNPCPSPPPPALLSGLYLSLSRNSMPCSFCPVLPSAPPSNRALSVAGPLLFPLPSTCLLSEVRPPPLTFPHHL